MIPRSLLGAFSLLTFLASTTLTCAAASLVAPKVLESASLGSVNPASCESRNLALKELIQSRDVVGGKILVMVGGADQSFADTWRSLAGLKPVKVSLILAHGFTRPIDDSDYVEIIEFGDNGCALSRTFIPGNLWDTIIRALKSESYSV
jgi:hypothetical protein